MIKNRGKEKYYERAAEAAKDEEDAIKSTVISETVNRVSKKESSGIYSLPSVLRPIESLKDDLKINLTVNTEVSTSKWYLVNVPSIYPWCKLIKVPRNAIQVKLKFDACLYVNMIGFRDTLPPLIMNIELINLSQVPTDNYELRLCTDLPQLNVSSGLFTGLFNNINLSFLYCLRPMNVEKVVGDIRIKRDLKVDTKINKEIFSTSLGALVGSGLASSVNLLEYLLGIHDLTRNKLSLPRTFSCWGSDVVVFIVIEDEDTEWFLIISYLISEVLREVACSRAKVVVRRGSEEELFGEESIDSVKLYSLRPLDLRCKVEVFDYRGSASIYAKEVLEILRSRLNTLYSHGPGAIIIAVSDEIEGQAIYDLLSNEKVFEVPTRAVLIKPNENLKRLGEARFTKLLLGINWVSCHSIPSCMRAYRQIIAHTMEALSILVKRQVGKEGEHVDQWQYPLKVAAYASIVKNLLMKELSREGRDIEELRKLPRIKLLEEIISKVYDKVHVEEKLRSEELKSNDRIPDIPDIWFEDSKRKICVEVESLIGTGEPMKKIDETIEKYKNVKVNELWIVIKPIDAILHYRELIERLNLYNGKWKENLEIPKIKIKVLSYEGELRGDTPNVLLWELRNLKEYVREVKELEEAVKQVEKLSHTA